MNEWMHEKVEGNVNEIIKYGWTIWKFMKQDKCSNYSYKVMLVVPFLLWLVTGFVHTATVYHLNPQNTENNQTIT